jgi:UDP-N-acetylglucosamine acyltransferase
MSALIHATAVIDPKAELDSSVKVGPYSVIGPKVRIGKDCVIGPHVVFDGPTTIGERNEFFSFASIGAAPQDKKFRGEDTELIIGNGNTIRESVTLNRGTVQGGGKTVIGDDNWIMAYVHIAHDCIIGSQNIFANSATLAGHVTIEDFVILGGFTLVHQFCRIGSHAFTGMNAKINGDVPPFVMIAGEMSSPRGINSEGLKRRGFAPDQISAIRRAYKTLYASELPLKDACAQISTVAATDENIAIFLQAVEMSERGIQR